MQPATAEARRRFRATTPPTYRWTRHVALVAAFAASGVALPLAFLGGVRPGEWSVLAAILLAIVLGEYASHRWSMHRPRFPRAVYHRHVVEHHAFFTEADMTIASWGDLRWVLFPPWALPLLVVTVAPLAAALWRLAGPRPAGLLVLAVVAYYGVYEVVHVLAHVPPRDGRVGRMIAAITRHHRVHHDPALMRRWNFNFVVPLGDWLCGTTWRGEAPSRREVSADDPRPRTFPGVSDAAGCDAARAESIAASRARTPGGDVARR